MAIEDNPSRQIREAFVTYLQQHLPLSCGIAEGAVRGVLDISGDPRGTAGVFVQSRDEGDHLGGQSRDLVDISLQATAYTHLDEDADGSQLEHISDEVQGLIMSFSPSLDGWEVTAVFAPTAGETSVLATSFRSIESNFKIFIQKQITTEAQNE